MWIPCANIFGIVWKPYACMFMNVCIKICVWMSVSKSRTCAWKVEMRKFCFRAPARLTGRAKPCSESRKKKKTSSNQGEACSWYYREREREESESESEACSWYYREREERESESEACSWYYREKGGRERARARRAASTIRLLPYIRLAYIRLD